MEKLANKAVLAAIIASLAMSSVAFLHATGTIPFPGGGQIFTVSVQYQAAAPSTSSGTFTAGSSVNVILTLVNNGNQGQVAIVYNSTAPGQFSGQDVNSGCASGSNQQCSQPLSMTDTAGRIFAPTNTPYPGILISSLQTANHGTNTFTFVLAASQQASLQSFTLFWTAQPQ